MRPRPETVASELRRLDEQDRRDLEARATKAETALRRIKDLDGLPEDAPLTDVIRRVRQIAANALEP